jgi:hypothetical protein
MVMAMAAVHEEMHQWTGQQGQPNEQAEHMGPVLCGQQRSTDAQKSDDDDRGPNLDRPAPLRALSASKVILHRHGHGTPPGKDLHPFRSPILTHIKDRSDGRS